MNNIFFLIRNHNNNKNSRKPILSLFFFFQSLILWRALFLLLLVLDSAHHNHSITDSLWFEVNIFTSLIQSQFWFHFIPFISFEITYPMFIFPMDHFVDVTVNSFLIFFLKFSCELWVWHLSSLNYAVEMVDFYYFFSFVSSN